MKPKPVVGTSTDDELGDLAWTMRSLVGSIHSYETELESWQRELEETIEERTKELVEANEHLEREVSIRKQAEERHKRTLEELERSNNELEQFAYAASHDLQEPLRSISGFLQLVQRRYEGQLDEEARAYIQRSVDATARMQAMVQSLLAISRIQRHSLVFQQIDSQVILDRALANLHESVRQSGLQVSHDPLPTVQTDSSLLALVFQNLISNAIKYRSDEPPRIHLSCQEADNHWRFSLRDNGIGIDSRYGERIFQVFQRLHTQSEYPGTGIGLSVCKKIVERHGGRIWMESDAVSGTTFHFTILKKRRAS